MAQELRLAIVDGPGKYELSVGLFDNTMEHPRYVEFTFTTDPSHMGSCPDWFSPQGGPRQKFQVSTSSVEREDGSGESWNITGAIIHETGYIPFSGYYTSRRRTGCVMFKQ